MNKFKKKHYYKQIEIILSNKEYIYFFDKNDLNKYTHIYSINNDMSLFYLN